ncbi:MAG TPA: acyl-CoA carboxylase epsilon subunit [Candidatus Nanopelagicales bacterium]
MTGGAHDRPVLRIVHGDPTAEELAAVVAVLAAAATSEADGATAAEGSHWAAPVRLLRPAVAPTGWWASGLPH